MAAQLTFVFRKDLSCRHSISFSGLCAPGSCSTISSAIARTYCSNCPSRAISAIFKSKATPLCCVPSKSPGPRNFKSTSNQLPLFQSRHLCVPLSPVAYEYLRSVYNLSPKYNKTGRRHALPDRATDAVAKVRNVQHSL